MLRERPVRLDLQPYKLTRPVTPRFANRPQQGCTPPLPDWWLGIMESVAPQRPTEIWVQLGSNKAFRMLTLEPERLKNQRTTTRTSSPEREGGSLHRRHSSGLRLQFLSVEVFSLLPLARQREPYHLRLDAFGHTSR